MIVLTSKANCASWHFFPFFSASFEVLSKTLKNVRLSYLAWEGYCIILSHLECVVEFINWGLVRRLSAQMSFYFDLLLCIFSLPKCTSLFLPVTIQTCNNGLKVFKAYYKFVLLPARISFSSNDNGLKVFKACHYWWSQYWLTLWQLFHEDSLKTISSSGYISHTNTQDNWTNTTTHTSIIYKFHNKMIINSITSAIDQIFHEKNPLSASGFEPTTFRLESPCQGITFLTV